MARVALQKSSAIISWSETTEIITLLFKGIYFAAGNVFAVWDLARGLRAHVQE